MISTLIIRMRLYYCNPCAKLILVSKCVEVFLNMHDLEQELINTFGDGFEKRADTFQNSMFTSNRQSWITSVIEDYTKRNINPNNSIIKIASDYKLNGDQIQRIIEEVNVGIYLQKYASTKGKALRSVEFPVADPDIINNGISKTAATITSEQRKDMDPNMFGLPEERKFPMPDKEHVVKAWQFLGKSKLDPETKKAVKNKIFARAKELGVDTSKWDTEKVASVIEPEEIGLTPGIWEQDNINKVAATMLSKKLNEQIMQGKEATLRRINDMHQKLAFITESLIHNERAGESAQDLLDKLACDADLEGDLADILIKNAATQVSILKEAHILPSNFDMELTQPTVTSEMGLGKHSLMKKAEEEYTVRTKKLPVDADYAKLVQIAKEIQQQIKDNPEDKQNAVLIIKK